MASVAALAVADTASSGSAVAASGSPLVMGTLNDAGNSLTALTSADNSGPTLALANTANLAPLNLAPQTFPASPSGTSGDLVNYDGDLYYADGFSSVSFVYTAFTATQLVPIRPQRVLDTRNAPGRVHITNPSGNLDSAGRLLANHTIVVTLGGLVVGSVAAYGNLTAVAPLGAGFLVLWPAGSRPGVSSVNFPSGAIVANFAVTGTSTTDTVSISTSATTHVLLDIGAFAVGNPAQVNPAVLSTPQTGAARERLAARARAGALPSWYTGG